MSDKNVYSMPAMAERTNTPQEDQAKKNWSRYCHGLSRGHKEWQKRAKRQEDFYLGGGRQWEPEVVANMGDRPVVEADLIFATVNTVNGYQTQSRVDLTYKPRQAENQETSDDITKVAMFYLDYNRYPWVESQYWADGMVQDRGFCEVRMNFERNLYGDIEIRILDPLNVIIDPDANAYDSNEWRDVIEAFWATVDDIRVQYGDEKADLISRDASRMGYGGWLGRGRYDFYSEPENTFGNAQTWNQSEGYYADAYYLDSNELAKELYVRVIRRQHWEVDERLFFVTKTGDFLPVPDDMDEKQAKRTAKRIGMADVVERTVKRVRWTTSTRCVVLEDDWSPYENITIVPFFPYFRRGKTAGLVTNLVDMQDLLNKVMSQMAHIVNSTANSGWTVYENSLANMEVEDLEEHGSDTGLVLEVRQGAQRPEKIQPNQIPSGLDSLVQKAVELIRLISGVSDTFQGGKSNEISGIAIQSKVQQSVVQLATAVDNLQRTRHMIGERILELIQKFITDERTFLITTHGKDQPNIEVTLNKADETGKILNDVTTGVYEVVIADVPTSITFDQAQLALAIEMRKYGVNIPDKYMVLMSGLSMKKEISDEISGQTQDPEQQKALQAQTEQLEAMKEKLEAEAHDRHANAQRKLIEVAKVIREQPGIERTLDELNEAILREDDDERLGQRAPTPPEQPADPMQEMLQGMQPNLEAMNPGAEQLGGFGGET